MIRIPDSDYNLGDSPDNAFENLYITGKLNYNFDNDDVVVKSIDVTSSSAFTGDITAKNGINVLSGNVTVNSANIINNGGGFIAYSPDASIRYQVTVNNSTGVNLVSKNTIGSYNTYQIDANTFEVRTTGTNSPSNALVVDGNGKVGLTTGLTVGPLTGTTGIGATISHHGNASFTGVCTASSFVGNGAALTGIQGIPSGVIMLWSGAADAIPSGFVLCNGSNSTPDLRGRFVVGYHDSNGDYDVDDTGGAESVTLSTSQLPSHSHSFTVNNEYADLFHPKQGMIARGENKSGTESFSTNSTGSGSAHENRPPYYALCYIMKT